MAKSRDVYVELDIQFFGEQGDVAQIFCLSTGEKYSGKRRVVFNYDEKSLIGENTYRFSGILPCGDTTQKLRFDPMWASGHAVVHSFRVKYFDWVEADLKLEFDRSMKILNGIEKFYLKDGALHIVSETSDPFIELSSSFQQYLTLPYPYIVKEVLKSAVVIWALFNFLVLILSILLKNGLAIDTARRQISNHLNWMIDDLGDRLWRWFLTKRSTNILVLALAFLITCYANFIYVSNIYVDIDWGAIFAFSSSLLQILALPLLVYFLLDSVLSKWRIPSILLGGTLLFLSLVYVADAYLVRLNGMHVLHGLGMLFDGGLQNLAKNIKFTKLSTSTLLIYQVSILLLIFGSLWLSAFLQKLSQRINFKISILFVFIFSGVALILVYMEQMSFAYLKGERKLAEEQQTLPFYIVFREAKDHLLVYDIEVVSYEGQNDLINITKKTPASTKGKQVYLFILESVREDVVNAEVTPNIYRLKQDATSFKRAISNGNATHYGWYSIINSKTPLFWETYRNRKNLSGSEGLQALKKAGYKINIHSAKDLSYLQSDRVMFGKDDPVYHYLSDVPRKLPPENDTDVIEHLIKTSLEESNQNSFNAVFLDSTHFPYRWLPDSIKEFKPYVGEPLGSLSLNVARDLAISDKEKIFNRYKNSVRYTDRLFGLFIDQLKNSKLYEEALIVVVGDHGQQFMEHNYLMHGKSLYSEDVHIPLYVKLPGKRNARTSQVGNQIDIMATVLDHAGIDGFEKYSDGSSLLNSDGVNFGVSFAAGMQNTPHSFVLETTDWKVVCELEQRAPKESKILLIKKILTSDDIEYVPGEGKKSDYEDFVSKNFGAYFKKLSFLKSFKYNPDL